MATTGVSLTPALASAPSLAMAPALAARPSVAPSPGPGTPGSITSKEWVIPPRPKPGRKPATDTPPTKRKAQNRAAQRAFRERRAARVQELEELMKDMEDNHDNRSSTLAEQISNLSREVDQCREEMAWWRDRCHTLEKEVAIERSAKEALVKEFRASMSSSNTKSPMPDSVPLPPRTRPSTRSTRMEGVVSTTTRVERNREPEPDNVPLGCGDCSSAHCQCIEDAFGMPIDTHESRGRYPPHGVGSPEREISEPEIKPDPEEMEIDFTARFSGVPVQPISHHHHNINVSSPPVDPCGFCQDGTPCICAEMAAQEEERARRNSFDNPRLAPIQSISQFTPPPSDGDVTLPPISQATNPCANGPASRSASGTPAGGGCCGGKGADGGCCMSRNAPTAPTTRNNPPMPAQPVATKPSTPNALTLSCADAFTTLSRHPNFSRASDEISTWLPKLHTLPNPRDQAAAFAAQANGDRAALEVEAASVMGVLRYFDRRFASK
ncbi:hypothetical protein N7454_002250 [Penicillium verhagenii]|nr:hypothetical protein N7454_002250 [Penicillium verhagenii]